MFARIPVSPAKRRESQSGFTLIELLVVIVVLGVLSAVVVFAVKGVGDKGKSAAVTTDAKTVRTAEEAYCAKNGSYGTEQDLVDSKLLSATSQYSDVAPIGGGPCGTSLDKSGFLVGYGTPNAGSPSSISNLTLTASANNGWPTPFEWVRGPGNLLANYIFDPLVWRDQTGNPIPWLATGWTTSPDGKTWTFNLRNGVTWQDGQPFTADDVAFTFDYQTGTPSGASHAAATAQNQCFCKSYFQYIDSVTADTPTQVTFHLNTAFNTFMTNIAQGFIIIPKHIWQTISTPFAQHTNAAAYVGTGPYVLQNPTTYNNVTGVSQYTANTNFFLGTPYVRKLSFVTVADPVAALSTGAIDAGAPGNEESVTDAALAPLSGLPRIENPGGWNRSLHFNLTKGFPYNNVSFRQAVAYAIDRQQLLNLIVGGRGQVPSMGTLSPSHPYAAAGLPTYIDDASHTHAKALLDSIGLIDTDSDGKRNLPAGANFVAHLRTTSRFSSQTVTVVQSQMLAVGIDSVLDATDANDNQATAGNYFMMFEGWGNITSDPDNLRTRLSDSWTSQAANQSFTAIYGWNNTANAAEFQALANQQLVETDPNLRKQEVQQMQRDVAADVPELQLYVPTAILIYQKNGFSAWYSTPGGTPPGPPGFNNKHVFVTGKQFGLPAGY